MIPPPFSSPLHPSRCMCHRVSCLCVSFLSSRSHSDLDPVGRKQTAEKCVSKPKVRLGRSTNRIVEFRIIRELRSYVRKKRLKNRKACVCTFLKLRMCSDKKLKRDGFRLRQCPEISDELQMSKMEVNYSSRRRNALPYVTSASLTYFHRFFIHILFLSGREKTHSWKCAYIL